MSTFWKKDGVLVKNAEGKVVRCDTCPCGPPPPVPCNGHDIPSVLYATFGGDFAYLGTLTITYNSGASPPGWYSAPNNPPCGGGAGSFFFSMECLGDGTFNLRICVLGGFGCASVTSTPVSYAPFYTDGSNPTMITPACFLTRNFSVAVTEVAP